MNVKQILRKHGELWEKAKRLNPAFAPQGSNLSGMIIMKLLLKQRILKRGRYS